MRELKLRAWDINDKWMDDDFYISSKGDVLDRPNITYDTPNIEIEHVCNLVVMQFTGLQDKNGVDIYEGDILSFGDDELDYREVYFNDGSFCVDYIQMGNPLMYLAESSSLSASVIGNIHENPELLEAKNVK